MKFSLECVLGVIKFVTFPLRFLFGGGRGGGGGGGGGNHAGGNVRGYNNRHMF